MRNGTRMSWVAISLLSVLVHGVVANPDAAAAAPTFGNPKETFQTFLNAVLQDDLDAAKACWATSDGKMPEASESFVEYLVYSLRFAKMVHDNFKDFEKQGAAR